MMTFCLVHNELLVCGIAVHGNTSDIVALISLFGNYGGSEKSCF